MDIYVFSGNRKVGECFGITRKTANFTLPQYRPIKDFSRELGKIDQRSLVYLDIWGINETDVSSYLRSLSKKEDIFYGIIDTTAKITDVAGVFHDGAVDYIGKPVTGEAIDTKRLNRVLRFIKTNHSEKLKLENRRIQDGSTRKWIFSGDDWRHISSGNEYTFLLMFIELDDKEELEKRYERDNLTDALESFRRFVDQSVRPFNGRIWIWNQYGGLILFPFGSKLEAALRAGFRLILFRHLFDIEESRFPNFLSIRLALHVGNLVYQEKNTGHIISDSLNSVFHLGQQFTETGRFCVTDEVLKLIDSPLKGFFFDVGTFERRKIYCMRRPMHSRAKV